MARLARTAAALTLTTGLALSLAPATAHAADPQVPIECGAWVTGYSNQGVRTAYGYIDGKAQTETYSEPKLGSAPVDVDGYGGAGDPTTFISTGVVLAQNGDVYNLVRRGTLTSKGKKSTWTVTHERQNLASGWTDTSDVVMGGWAWDKLYRVQTDGTVIRYDADLRTGTLANPIQVGNLGSDIQTVTAYRQVRDSSTVTADVWVVTRTDGSVDEVVIPAATPASFTVTELRATGFAGLKSLTIGWCGEGDARALTGVNTKGEVRMWFDPNSADSNGSDIVGGSAVVAKGWRNVTYN